MSLYNEADGKAITGTEGREQERMGSAYDTVTDFGCWEYNRQLRVLLHRAARHEIDLDHLTDGARILDAIFEVSEQEWADAGTCRDLLTALSLLLQPKRNYCPFGMNRAYPPEIALMNNGF